MGGNFVPRETIMKDAQVFDVMIISRRTASGMAEIRNKTHELTQSERLVRIIVDGVAPCDGLREKLKDWLKAGSSERCKPCWKKGCRATRVL